MGPGEDEDVLAVATLFGPDNRLTEAAREAINALWCAACSVIDQLAAPVVQATAGDLAQLLDRVMTEPPF